MSRARSAARRVFTLLDTPAKFTGGDANVELNSGTVDQAEHEKSSKKKKKSKKNKQKQKPLIEFEDVRFGYNRDTVILKKLSFSIQKGETIGLVGSTGAGS